MKVESLKFLFIGMGLTQALFFLTAPFFKKISHYILILFAVSTSYYIYFSEPLISGKGLEFLFFQLSSITLAYSILYHFFENRINVIYKIAFILLLFLSVGLYFPVSRGNDFIYHNARFIVLLLSLLSLRLLAKELKPEIRKIFLPSYILWCLSVFNDFLILSGVYTFSLLSSYGMFIFLLSFSYYRIKLLSSPETSQSNVILKNELETIQTQVENEYYPIIQLAAEISVISYFVVNKDASICYANKAAAEIIGFTREELLQMSYLDINPDFNPKSWEEHWQTLKEQTSFTYISLNQTKENILIPVEITDNYISSHSKEYCLSIIQDIRKRKKAEEDLREEKEKAEEATRLKDKFISLVSHDLRSPLSGMLAFFEMMIEDEDEFRPKDRKEMYLNFYNSIQSLLGMIDKLLNLNRLQSGRLTLQPEFIELKAILDDIIPQFHPLIQRKDITLVNQVKKQTKIFIDPNLFREVLTNLLSNAVKFCSAKDTIEIIPHEGDRFLEIKDSGKGIPEEFLPDLFKEEIKTTTIGTLGEIGTGLGLPFCKDIMEAHSGDIQVQSQEGKGTSFFLSLPMNKKIILIVEDQEIVREQLKEILRATDTIIIEAENGLIALELLRHFQPALIITDISMPEMDGFEFLGNIKIRPQFESIPVIILTSVIIPKGKSYKKYVQLANEIGVQHVLPKPASKDIILPRVMEILESDQLIKNE